MRVSMVPVAISLLFWPTARAQHRPGWVACEFKWQDAGKPADYQKFMNECVASHRDTAPATEVPQTKPGQAIWPAPDVLPPQPRQATQTPQPPLQWDHNKAIQNAKLDVAVNEFNVCVRDASTIALRTGVRTREQLGSAVVSLCKAQLTFFFVEAKAANMTIDEQKRVSTVLLEDGMDRVLRQGQ